MPMDKLHISKHMLPAVAFWANMIAFVQIFHAQIQSTPGAFSLLSLEQRCEIGR